MKITSRLRRALHVLRRRKGAKTDNCEAWPPDALVQNQDFDLSETPPCPKCHSGDVARIVYGKPALTRQVLEGLESGQIISGGCLLHGGAPEWHCQRCNRDFGHINFTAPNGAVKKKT